MGERHSGDRALGNGYGKFRLSNEGRSCHSVQREAGRKAGEVNSTVTRSHIGMMPHRVCIISLIVFVSGDCYSLQGEAAVCIDAMDYQRISKNYAELFSKYELPTVAQEFLNVRSATQDLKQRMNICQKNRDETDSQRCDPLVKQYNTKQFELEDVASRFNSAMVMQEYLLTVKVQMEQPRCEK
jgi:hypothetical protein